MPMQISGVTIQGGMNILPRAGAPSPAPTPGPSPAPGPSDPDFSNVVFMFDGDGTDGGANNTFTDSSTNGHAITENGDVTQGSFSPYGDNWSNYFDYNAYINNVRTTSSNPLGTQDFTIEFFFNATEDNGSYKSIYGEGYTAQIYYQSGEIRTWFSSSDSTAGYFINNLTPGGTPTPGQWHHFAVVRNGNTFTAYLDGVGGTSQTSSTAVGTATFAPTIGANALSINTYQYSGYVSNFRMVIGTAVYTSDFTPPDSPLTAITNTEVLTCSSNAFKDKSTNNYSQSPATTGSDVPKVTPFSPFKDDDARDITTDGGSAYFDGDYLQTPNSASLNLSSGNWTMEGWIYALGDGYGKRYVILEGSSRTFGLVRGNNNTFEWNFFGTRAEIISSTNSFHLNTWVHFALVSNSTNITLYIDGVSQGTTTNYPDNSAHYVTVGASTIRYPGTDSNAYVSDLRIVRGTAVYTANFTPPTAPLTAVTNTELLLNFQDSAIYDYSGQNNIDTVGNAQIDTAIKKYGTGSLEFDGTGDGLAVPANESHQFGTGDFTVEFWVYMNSNSTDYSFISRGTPSPTVFDFFIQYRPSVSNSLKVNTASSYAPYDFSWTPSANTWYHIAVTRSGTDLKAFVDGVQIGTTQTDSNDISANVPLGIGYNIQANLQYLDGYIDDLRITKGVARYTTNFTPPTEALPKF